MSGLSSGGYCGHIAAVFFADPYRGWVLVDKAEAGLELAETSCLIFAVNESLRNEDCIGGCPPYQTGGTVFEYCDKGTSGLDQ